MRNIIILTEIIVVVLSVGCGPKNNFGKIAVEEKYGDIVFTRLTDGYWQIWTVNPDGTGLKQITDTPHDKRYPLWTQGGNILHKHNSGYVIMLDIPSLIQTKITHNGPLEGIYISPDGMYQLMVVYDNQLRDSADIWLNNIYDGQFPVTRDAGIEHEPSWLPDGGGFVYISRNGYRTSELYITSISGSNKTRLTNNNYREALPCVSPDGGKIAYARETDDDYEIWVMNIDGSEPIQLTDSDGLDTRPFWSPDGKQIVFASNRSGSLQLWIMNSDGSDTEQLTFGAPSMDPSWRW